MNDEMLKKQNKTDWDFNCEAENLGVQKRKSSLFLSEKRAEEANGLKKRYIYKKRYKILLFYSIHTFTQNTTSQQILICTYKYTLVNPFEFFM